MWDRQIDELTGWREKRSTYCVQYLTQLQMEGSVTNSVLLHLLNLESV